MPNAREEFQAVLQDAQSVSADITAANIALDGLLFALRHVSPASGSDQEQLVRSVADVAARLSPVAKDQVRNALRKKFKLTTPAINQEFQAAQQALRRTTAAELTHDPETGLPYLCLPGPQELHSSCAGKLGKLLAAEEKVYVRGGGVVTVGVNKTGAPILNPVDDARLCSLAESYCIPAELDPLGMPEKTVLDVATTKILLKADALLDQLPPITVITPCPVLTERAGGALEVVSGYDRESEIWASGDVEEVSLGEAVTLLSDLFSDTAFATEEDRSRAMAAVLTPAFVFGDLLGGRPPILFVEADSSQAGKGYFLRCIAAIYGFKLMAVSQIKRGVGSIEELFDSALIKGYPFVSLDNIKGTFESQRIESFMTEDQYEARAPYISAVIDPTRVVVGMTSNGAVLSEDMANRCVAIKIRRQRNKRWRKFGGGLGLLEFVRQYRALYLGAVFAVIREWHRCGKLETGTTAHDRREWAGKMDWIVQNIFHFRPLLEGHEETRQRMANPHLSWLREVCLAARAQGRLDEWLRTNKVVDVLETAVMELPGAVEGQDSTSDQARNNIFQATGGKLARCFDGTDVIRLDQFVAERRKYRGERHDSWEYRFGESDTVPPVPAPAPSAVLPPDQKPIPAVLPDVSNKALETEKINSGVQDLVFSATEDIKERSGETGAPAGTAPSASADYRLVSPAHDLAAVIGPYVQAPVLGVDTETTGLDPLVASMRLVQLAADGQPTLLIDCRQLSAANRAVLLAVLAGPAIKLFHNAKFDLKFLRQAGIEVGGPIFDTMLAAQLLDAGLRRDGHTLADLARDYLGQALPKELQTSDWSGNLKPEQLAYAARDAAVLLPLYAALHQRVVDAQLLDVANMEGEVVRVVADIELAGMLLDQGRWETLRTQLTEESARASATLLQHFQTVAPNINLDSPKQLLKALQALGIGLEDTNSETLIPLAGDHPVIQALLYYRKTAKLAEAFGDKMLGHVNQSTGRIHPTYMQLGAATGRFSCGNPNLQQVPAREGFRACFVAPHGYKLVIADYSQIELRVLAELCAEKRMVQAFQEGQDLHRLTASFIADKPMNNVTDQERKGAKPINFGLIFGMGAEGLRRYALKAYDVVLTAEQAQAFRQRYFKAYPDVALWQRRQGRVGDNPPWEVRTLSGRRRTWSEEPKFTELCNTPVQGTAADIMKRGLVLVHQALHGSGARIIGTVHDEVIIEVPVERAENVAAIVKAKLEEAGRVYLKAVPVIAEVSVGDSWADK